jgi:hypothetical protein
VGFGEAETHHHTTHHHTIYDFYIAVGRWVCQFVSRW